MTTKEKLEIIEEALRVKPNTLKEETDLSTLKAWDSLSILNLQIRISAINPDLQFSDLFGCDTVGEICKLMEQGVSE